MAATGFTPISLYYSATLSAVPSAPNLVAGELALNTNDGKLYFKNSVGVVTLLAGSTSGPAGGSNTQVQYNNSGVLAGITGATSNGTALTLVAPNLGTPASATLTNATGLPISTGVSGLGTNVATALGVNTGTAGAFVVNGGALGTPSSGTVTNLTGTASININGTVGATTPAAGAFTTLNATGTITQTGAGGTQAFNQTQSASAAIANTKTATTSNSLGAYDAFVTKDNTGTTNTWAVGVNVNSANSSWELYNGGTRFSITQAGAVFIGGNTSATGNVTIAPASGAARLDLNAGGGSAIYLDDTSANGQWLLGANNYAAQFEVYNVDRGSLDLKINNATGLATFANSLAVTGTLSARGALAATAISTPTLWLENTTAGKYISIKFSGSVQDGYFGYLDAATSSSRRFEWWDTSASKIMSLTGDGKLTVTDTLAGGTSGTGYSFSGSAPANSLTLNSSGNLGIGTALPGAKLDVSSAGNLFLSNQNNAGNNSQELPGYLEFTGAGWNTASASQPISGRITFAGAYDSAVGNVLPYLAFSLRPSNGSLTERMRLDSSGNLLVGSTTDLGAGVLQVSDRSGRWCTTFTSTNPASGTYYFLNLSAGNSNVGSITSNGTITVYATTSDYRLKTVVGAVTGQGARIDALEPIEYTWNSNGSRTRGFLAHQFQEVYAGSVTGTKDAIDADGKPVYQAMQASTSEVIADLVAELQSLRARVAQLESKL